MQKYLKSFNWRSLKRLTSPNAAAGLNAFLEKLPQNAGQTMLIIAGACWAFAAAIGLYTTVQLQQLTELRANLENAQALKPRVPQIKDVAVNEAEVKAFVGKIEGIYTGLSIKSLGTSVEISAPSTAMFGQFREAMGHVQNGGAGWRVNIENMCVGRECQKFPLFAVLNINKVSVN
ncbi:MAG: hypothetical protein IT559_07440 [Alphaproteobacteria bacterium]|nr:hypothetical protein [Alphaproteobacteria bacterium]